MEHKMKHKEVIKLVKRNEAQEVLNSAAEYASKNTENIIIGLVVVAVVGIGIPLFLNGRKAGEVKAQQVLAKGNYFLTRPVVDQKDAQMYGMFRTKEERLEKAIMAYNEVINTYRGTKSVAYAYIGIGDAYFNHGKPKEALEYYNTFIERYKKHLLVPEALAGRAYANYELGKYSDALADLKAVTENHKSAAGYYDARMKAADCLVKLNDISGARQEYEGIIKDADGSYWAGAAKEKIKGLAPSKG